MPTKYLLISCWICEKRLTSRQCQHQGFALPRHIYNVRLTQMNTATASSGRLILIGAIALIMAPYAWTAVSADLGAYSLPPTLMTKIGSLAIGSLLALALFRFRWLQLGIGVISAIVGLYCAFGCVASLRLALRGRAEILAGTPLVSLFAFVAGSLFVAWAFLLSHKVRDYRNKT